MAAPLASHKGRKENRAHFNMKITVKLTSKSESTAQPVTKDGTVSSNSTFLNFSSDDRKDFITVMASDAEGAAALSLGASYVLSIEPQP